MLKIIGKIVFSSEILHNLCTVEFTRICFPPQQWMNVFFLFILFFMFRHAWSSHACCNCNLSCRLGRRKFLFAMGFHSVTNLYFFVTSIPVSLYVYKQPPFSLSLSLSLTHTHTHTHTCTVYGKIIYTYICIVCVCVCVCLSVYTYRPVVYTFLITIKSTL